MRNSGFKMDMTRMRRKQAQLAAIPARIFKPELVNNLLRPSLNKAKAATPVRPLETIRWNQIEKPRNQYHQWQEHGGHGISKREWITFRGQARFLFQQQWVHVGYSLGVNVTASAQVLAASTRNPNEPAIPRSFGQWHGGETKFTASIHTPWLDEPEREYKPFTGEGILVPIMNAQFPVYHRAIARKMKRVVYAIAHANN